MSNDIPGDLESQLKQSLTHDNFRTAVAQMHEEITRMGIRGWTLAVVHGDGTTTQMWDSGYEGECYTNLQGAVGDLKLDMWADHRGLDLDGPGEVPA